MAQDMSKQLCIWDDIVNRVRDIGVDVCVVDNSGSIDDAFDTLTSNLFTFNIV